MCMRTMKWLNLQRKQKQKNKTKIVNAENQYFKYQKHTSIIFPQLKILILHENQQKLFIKISRINLKFKHLKIII